MSKSEQASEKKKKHLVIAKRSKARKKKGETGKRKKKEKRRKIELNKKCVFHPHLVFASEREWCVVINSYLINI